MLWGQHDNRNLIMMTEKKWMGFGCSEEELTVMTG